MRKDSSEIIIAQRNLQLTISLHQSFSSKRVTAKTEPRTALWVSSYSSIYMMFYLKEQFLGASGALYSSRSELPLMWISFKSALLFSILLVDASIEKCCKKPV